MINAACNDQLTEWLTPSFAQIRKKKTKRLSPYSESEIWDLDELKTIIKYEPSKRNKAAIALMWDLNARNHEITLLRIKHVRLRERYGEGEIPHQAKTGSGPILLTFSFPYVRDWLNEHPFRNTPEARLICNLINGAPITPEALWTIMKQLRTRITRMAETDAITDVGEKEKLRAMLATKKFNPYCFRHSSISHDSDFLPDYALKKKVRWSMNSKQPSRYIKARMGNDLKQKILVQNGILTEADVPKPTPTVSGCARCRLVNTIENKYCSSCGYPLSVGAYEELKAAENEEMNKVKLLLQELESEHSQQIANLNAQLNEYRYFAEKTALEINDLKIAKGLERYEISKFLIEPNFSNIVDAINELRVRNGQDPVAIVTPQEAAEKVARAKFMDRYIRETEECPPLGL
jgi:ribosomal protein L37E